MRQQMLLVGVAAAGVAVFGATRRDEARVVAAPAPIVGTTLAARPSDADAVFAGGCFWGVEAVFEHLRGVKSAVSGYAGGTTNSPTYEDVGTDRTGHAESVRVTYDPSKISYAQLLEVFFTVAHDPTQKNRQGPDVGTQYRSIAFYGDAAQKAAIESYIAQLTATKVFPAPIVTEVVALTKFYRAEDYHQDYMKHHPNQPYIVYNDAPKVAHLKQAFPALYRE